MPNYDYHMPMGLGYISSTLKLSGYQVVCLNLNHFKGNSEEILKHQLDSDNFDFVCTGGISHYRQIESILNTVHDHSSKPNTIVGGIIISVESEIVFEALKPTFGVIGEGEQTVKELLDCLEKAGDLRQIKGIMFRDDHGNTIRTGQRQPIEDLDSIPIPDFESLGLREHLDNQRPNFSYVMSLFDHPRPYPLLASRSCPFHCTFCHHDTKYRTRTIGNVIDEIALVVKNYQVNLILLYDECFSTNKQRVVDFCTGIRDIRAQIDWDLKWICQLRVHSVDVELLKIMKESGCCVISYGFESFSPVVLKSMRKQITPAQIHRTFKATLDAHITVQANFIFGDIAETTETAQTTLDYWGNNSNGMINLGFIRPYPGSSIYEHCLKKGLIKDKLDFIRNDFFSEDDLCLNMTDEMSDKQIQDLIKTTDILTLKYQNSVYPLSIKQTGRNLYSYKVKCCFCKTEIEYNNCYTNSKKIYFFVICRNCGYRFIVQDRFHYILHGLVRKHSFISRIFFFRREVKKSFKGYSFISSPYHFYRKIINSFS